MISFFKRCCESKRECITYVVVFFWVIIGAVASYFETNFTDLGSYFISLTGFVASYIFGESVRKSSKTSLFLSGPISKREGMVYLTILLWLIIGILTIINNGDLTGVSAYFASLTPFVGAYIIGETYKMEEDYDSTESVDQINS